MVAMKKSEKKEEDFAVNEDFHSFIHPSGQFHFVFCSSEREGDGERRGVHVTSGEYLLPIFLAMLV